MMRNDWRKVAFLVLALWLGSALAAQGGSGGPGGVVPSTGPVTPPGSGLPDREGGAQSASGAGTRSGAESGALGTFQLWLETSREVARFLPVRARIVAAAGPAIEAGAPPEAFRIRLKEAAAKGAPPDTTAEAIEADAVRWTELARSLGTDWPPASKAAAFYVSAALAMRNGVGLASVVEVGAWARDAKAGPERAAAALTVAATLRASMALSPAEAGRAALAVASSRLKVGDFDRLSELASRAARAGVAPSLFLAYLESTFGSGGRLKELELRIFP